MSIENRKKIIVIGGGPAGLMAAESVCQSNFDVHVYDAMPTVGRKFLLAGIGGLNLTHSEEEVFFKEKYFDRKAEISLLLNQFNNKDLQDWAHQLGVETFIGTSGRVFPKEMKAAPLLRAWLSRLKKNEVQFHMRHQWLGWKDKQLQFKCINEIISVEADAIIFALGGGSWAKLGSDGQWVSLITTKNINTSPLKPSNCGFNINWTAHFKTKFAGETLKTVKATVVDKNNQTITKKSQIVITETGIEGSLTYALSSYMRDVIEKNGNVKIYLDLLPDKSEQRVLDEVCSPKGTRTLSSHLKGKLGLDTLKINLLYECLDKQTIQDPFLLAKAIKNLPLICHSTRPINEAISTAGGVLFEELDEHLMSKKNPSLFFAGEMLDWEAPTGGYLLTACFASGYVAGLGAKQWLNRTS